MSLIRLVVADDHTLFRDGLRALFASIPAVELVGEAATGDEAIRLVDELRPDVVLMDIQMPDISGIDATRRIRERDREVGIIMVTMFEDDESLFGAMRAGARGYVLKGAEQEEMLRTIHAVARGEALFGAAVAARLSAYFARSPGAGGPVPFPELTEREREVLELVARGHNNRQIAHHLTVSVKTVRNHVSNIFNKLQVADRAEAIIRARKAGYGE